MQHHWLKKEGNHRLVIFALGWASDFHAVEHLDLPGYDALCLYDYRIIEPLESVDGVLDDGLTVQLEDGWVKSKQIAEGYKATKNKHITEEYLAANGHQIAGNKRIYLIAWSFGVLASEYIFGSTQSGYLTPYRAIALNGTPKPIDDRYGIPSRSFALTLRSIPHMGIDEFNRRTFGDYYEHIAPHLKARPFEEKLEELTELNALAKEPLISTIKWDRAVIGTKDLIFAPQNVATYWNDNDVPIDWEEGMPHYPFSDPQFIITKLLQTL